MWVMRSDLLQVSQNEEKTTALVIWWVGPGVSWACLISGNMKNYLKQLAHHRLNVLTNIALQDKKFDTRYNSPLNLKYFHPPPW